MTTTQTAPTRPDTRTDYSRLPSVLAIVVTHDGRKWFKDSLVGLNTQTYPLLDVLVVDDASPDPKRQPRLARIAKRHLRARRWGFLRTPRPLGFGGAINWALARVKADAELLLFIHDDAALDPTSVERMVARLLDDDVTAIVGPKIVSWDDPSHLEEVGMAIDRFGYPYKGLEEGEIDSGQHDGAREVFYVTSTCMLVRSDVFKTLKGWDARMRAFSEDLDLCWRARVAGYEVRIEPRATARHAIALATGQRHSRFKPTRYYIRRNRLRSVAKNVSGVRLLPLIPLFMVLWFAEMIAFIILRQPREILNLLRAIGWNIGTLPQLFAERARVQGKRRVTDRRLRGLHVKEMTRVRFYVSHKADRLEHAWEGRAEFLTSRLTQVREVVNRLRGTVGLVVFIAVLALLLGFRDFLWSPPATVGELLPFPDRGTGLWRAFTSAWQPVGFGYAGDGPPAFVFLGSFQLLALGAAGAAQKLLVATLGGVAFIGGYKLVADLVDRPARFAAGLTYAIGGIGYAGLREGRLGALAFGAAAPFVVLSILRLTGWSRPPGWARGRAVARVALGSAVSGAFVPGSLFLYLLVAAVLSGSRWVLERKGRIARGFYSSVIGVAVGWLLLLPWSLGWFSEGGAINLLTSEARGLYLPTWSGHGMVSVVLGQTPEVPVLAGLALPLLGLVAAFVGDGQRRRIALALWALVVTAGWVVTLIASGALPPILPTPTEAGVLAALAFAGLTGLAVGAFRLDLPRRGLGWSHAATITGLALAALLLTLGTVPALWHGEWAPGKGTDFAAPENVGQIRSVLAAASAEEGPFRTVWVGEEWASESYGAVHSPGNLLVTGPEGQTLLDLFGRRAGDAYADFERSVASIAEGTTDRGGSLLGAFNIRFVVLERGPGAFRWLAQRDLAVIRSEEDHLLLETQEPLARAAVYRKTPPHVVALASGDPASTAETPVLTKEASTVQRSSASKLRIADATGPGVVFLAEAKHDGWRARLDGVELERTDAGWGNGFEAPEGVTGELIVDHPRGVVRFIWILAAIVGWLAVLGAAFARPRQSIRHARGTA